MAPKSPPVAEDSTNSKSTCPSPDAPLTRDLDQTQLEKLSSSSTTTHKPLPDPSPPTTSRLQTLETKKAELENTLATLRSQRSALVAAAQMPSGDDIPGSSSEEQKTKSALATANVVIQHHIALLQKYNEIKDIGQGLMGFIAEGRGVRMATVMGEFGMSEND